MDAVASCPQEFGLTRLGDGVNLWLTEPDQHVDDAGIEGVFSQERHEASSGVIVSSGRQSPDLDLWLASHLPGFAALIAQQSALRWAVAAVR
ncbi:hypothetical protein [Saccharopolyspora sp. ASAGF58]|uniref:hypothetical protein n=1 Tax=Saccharopolyspora sp. ASAGF58 TaxID=2719023 RepID=UPI00144003A9|nr:hypothetical protein [Saccharopolyspora sp. ASAGF58]QIZ38546.1 hypothetical protein FDZ84_33470 [Saccharopolyspora sp. ASAGF58]